VSSSEAPSAYQSRKYVVVMFGGQADGCPLSHCPMHAHGPYTETEARDVAERSPLWMLAHVLTLGSDNDACLRDARHRP
jgi:hypothetical protein